MRCKILGAALGLFLAAGSVVQAQAVLPGGWSSEVNSSGQDFASLGEGWMVSTLPSVSLPATRLRQAPMSGYQNPPLTSNQLGGLGGIIRRSTRTRRGR